MLGLLSKPMTAAFRPDGAVLLSHQTRLGNALEPPRTAGGEEKS